MPSSSLAALRRTAAKAIGPFALGTATSGSMVALLEATGWPFKTSISQDSLFENYFIFRPSAAAADRTRAVASVTSSSGQYTPDLAWATAPYSGGAGETFELHGLIPPVQDGHNDLHGILNDVLKRLLVIAEFTVTPVADQDRHSLASAASWLTNESWVKQVGSLLSTDDRDEIDPFAQRPVRGHAYLDGSTVYIAHPGRTFSATSDVIYVRALKPAYYHCAASGGAWGTQSGLSLETDIAPVDDRWAASAVAVEVWNRFAYLLEGSDRVKLSRAEAAAWFSQMTAECYREPPLTFRSVTSWGPAR